MGTLRTIRKKLIKSSLLLIVLSLLVMVLCGFEETNQEERVAAYICQGRVISVEPPPPDTSVINVLVVEKRPIAEASEQGIYVLVTKDTIVSGGAEEIVSLEETIVLIKGIKRLETEGDQEVIVVEADSIEPLD